MFYNTKTTDTAGCLRNGHTLVRCSNYTTDFETVDVAKQ